MGQAKQKKQLTPADYDLWSTLENGAISDKGLWCSYYLRYKSGLDTLFVKSTDNKRTFSYPLVKNGKFNKEEWFGCFKGKGIFQLTNLNSGTQEFLTEISDFEFSENGQFLFLISKAISEKRIITIRNLLDGTIAIIKNVKSWRLNNDLNMLAYCVETSTGSEVIVRSLNNPDLGIMEFPFLEEICSNIIWQENSSSIVFVLQPFDSNRELNKYGTKLMQYRFSSKKKFLLSPKTNESFPKLKHIESSRSNDLLISNDGKRIFFQVFPDSLAEKEVAPLVEVWKGDDKLLYSERNLFGPLDEWSKSAVWYPEKDEVFDFMPKETHVILSGNQKFALSSSLEPCESQFKYTPDRDYYLTNLSTKERKLFLHCHSGGFFETVMSPSGKYIAYYSDGHWYSYCFATAAHKNLTKNVRSIFYDEANDIGDKPVPYGLIGWTENDASVLIYDKFDAWEISADGTCSKRLTMGREKGIIFRFEKTNRTKIEPYMGSSQSHIVDLGSSILLKTTTTDHRQQGYYIFKNGKATCLLFSPKRIYDLKKAKDIATYTYLQEDYEKPTSLQVISERNKSAQSVYLNNAHHDDYFWGKVETIHYVSELGKPLKGLLYYPSNFEKGKTYPMIVRVYEKHSTAVHYYRNPSVYLDDGFNVTNYSTQGYFVLLPDIEYQLGFPGNSAVFCTTAAVNEVLLKGEVNPMKLGIIGHSLGGFESSYIIAKSNIFRAAVAGASQTDYLSGYLTVSENYKKAEFWRFEYYTNRMSKPLFEDIEGYIYNSSVYNARTIETPLLLWTGERDKHVAATQSTELYLAMRRLGKSVTMLRYPNEDHSLANPIKQKDLAQKINEWFDYYLKDKPLKQWM